jgi:hypothetical protein
VSAEFVWRYGSGGIGQFSGTSMPSARGDAIQGPDAETRLERSM